MISAKEYTLRQNELLNEFETRVRDWLKENDEYNISDRIPFYRDGVVCPEVWFKPDNNFRPLFILKEVSIGKDYVKDLDKYLEIWGNQTSFEFVENPFDDIRIGKFTTWRKIAALAKGLEDVYNGLGIREYNIDEFSYMQGGEEYKGNIEGYCDYHARTANNSYNDIINKIAVLETKKIGGGRDVNSELSIATKYYSEHIEPFKDLICKEIELINPTVIVCCCREFFTGNLLREIENSTGNRLWIYGYHPTMNSTENFYKKPLIEYENNISKKS